MPDPSKYEIALKTATQQLAIFVICVFRNVDIYGFHVDFKSKQRSHQLLITPEELQYIEKIEDVW